MPRKKSSGDKPPAIETGMVEREIPVPDSLAAQVPRPASPKRGAKVHKMPESLRSELAAMVSEEPEPPQPPPTSQGSVVGRDQHFDGKKLVLNGVNVVDEDPADGRRYIPRKDVGRKLVPIIEKPTVLVADLADPKDKAEYERAVALIARSGGAYLTIDKEVGPEIILDPASPRGFRAIVILKYAKVSKIVVVTQQAYEEVREEDLKKRFAQEEPEQAPTGEDPLLTEQSPVT